MDQLIQIVGALLILSAVAASQWGFVLLEAAAHLGRLRAISKKLRESLLDLAL